MKRVLIIAHLGLASPRIIGLAKYLDLYGWKATILTPRMTSNQKLKFVFPDCPRLEIVETAKHTMHYGQELDRPADLPLVGRIVNSLKYRLNKYFISKYTEYPDSQKAWMPHALDEAGCLLQKRNYSALLSSSSPVSCHIISHKLKKLYNIPWVADFRDLWTHNHNYSHSSLRRLFERNLERKILSNSDAMITVSPQWVRKLREFHRSSNIHLITNGFEESPNQTKDYSNEKIVFSYTGRIYPGKQDCSKILMAISNLIEEGILEADKIEFNYYGPTKSVIESATNQFPSNAYCGWINLYDSVSRKQSYRIQRSSDILVLFNWEDGREKGVVPSKLFEYIGAKKHIIATGGYGSDFVAEILFITKGGFYCKDIEEIKHTIVTLIRKIRREECIYADHISNYSYRSLSRRLARVLNNVLV